MSQRRIRVTAIVDGSYRGLFSILERPNGELLIPNTSGGRYADELTVGYEAATQILEDRISIHLSLNSEEFTTIKKTTVLEGTRRITAVALTDAVKRKTGFSNIFVRRYENLSGDGYAPLGKAKVGDRLLVVPEHDPKFHTMFGALYLGHPDLEFRIAHKDPMLHIEPIKFRNFQVVVMFSLHPIRSHYSTEIASKITYDPKSLADDGKVAISYLQMQGKSAEVCVVQYQIVVWAMLRRVLKIELQEATTPEAIKDIKRHLRRIPKPVTRAGWDKQKQTSILYPPPGLFDENER
jgi:hypothetical protein